MMTSSLDWIKHGGFMMYPLLLSALIALTVIFERLYIFKTVFNYSNAEMQNTLVLIQKQNMDQAEESLVGCEGPVDSMLKVGIQYFGTSEAELETNLENEAQRWVPMLEKRVEILDTVITAAPLMGLLGTITGMMASFQILSDKGVNEPNAITGGIGEALTATATGLVVALVSLLFFNYFNSKIRLTIQAMEKAGSDLVKIKHRQVSGK